MSKKILILGYCMILGFLSCRDAYRPDLRSSPASFLVVEGVLDPVGVTTFTLSRVTKVDSAGFRPEANAQVIVEGKDNSVQQIPYNTAGRYVASLNLVMGNEYRLRIRTTNAKEYLSAYVKVKQTPAIDSIGWKRNDEGVQLYVNTHDASNDTRYYRWDYHETWEIRSYYYSGFIYLRNTNTVRIRTSGEDVSRCWKYDNASSIMLGSSERLQSDVIFQAPLNFIAEDNEKLCVRYSILLRQYALDKAGYKFYELMKRNTENLGSIFDAQPSEVKGNIQCVTDPQEPVIGYVCASTIVERRFFISNADLPGWRFPWDCPEVRTANHPDSLRQDYGSGSLSPYGANYAPSGPIIISYSGSTPQCVDCTSRGGSNVQPSYW